MSAQCKHLCYFYRTHAEMERCWVPFLVEGLKQNDKCIFVRGDDYSLNEAIQAIRDAGVDFDADMAGKKLEIVDNAGFPTAPNTAAEDIVTFWERGIRKALDDGFSSLRVAAQMTWLNQEQRSSDMIAHFELIVNRVFPVLPISAVCMYDTRIFGQAQLDRVEVVHPYFATTSTPGDVGWKPTSVSATQRALDAAAACGSPQDTATETLMAAGTLLKEEKFAESEALFRQAVQELENAKAPLRLITALLGLAQSLRGQEKRGEAIIYEERATEVLLSQKGRVNA